MRKLLSLVMVLLFVSGCSPTKPITEPVPEPPSYVIGEPKLADLERFSLYRDRVLTERPAPKKPTEPAEDTEPPRYELTDEERQLVERVVMAESGNQPYCGIMAVAQCLLNDCERSGIRPAEAVLEYQYTTNRVEPSEAVCEAVRAVFDRGEVVTEDTILWFYAPARVNGKPWHESQRHVLTINDHKFFAEKE